MAQITGFDDSEESEDPTFYVTVSGDVPNASGTLLITASRQGDSDVTIYSGTQTAGTYAITYSAQGNSLPAGTYTGLTAQWRGGPRQPFQYSLEHDGCDDGRSWLVVEYWVRHKTYIPRCEDFRYQPTTWAGNFGWTVIQSHGHQTRHPDHAIFQTTIDNSMERMRLMSSGWPTYNRVYSCPAHNATIPGAAVNSQHIYGDAADIASSQSNWQTIRNDAYDLLDPNFTNVPRPCAEPQSASGYGHVHIDHRNAPGAFVPNPGGGCPALWNLP